QGGERSRFRRLLKVLGPGLTTGVSDDDPSGSAPIPSQELSSGHAFLWTAPWCFPLMAAVNDTRCNISAPNSAWSRDAASPARKNNPAVTRLDRSTSLSHPNGWHSQVKRHVRWRRQRFR